MIRGLAAAALIGTATVALAVLGVTIVVPALIYRHWRRRLHPTAPPKWEILGPFAHGEMPPELQASWEELKRTGVTLATWDGPLEDF